MKFLLALIGGATLALGALGPSAAALAQSVPVDLDQHRPFDDTRSSVAVQASFTIPIGGQRRTDETSPRFELRGGPAFTAQTANGRRLLVGDTLALRLDRSSFSIRSSGQKLAQFSFDRLNAGGGGGGGGPTTGGWIAIGAGLLVVVPLVVFTAECTVDDCARD